MINSQTDEFHRNSAFRRMDFQPTDFAIPDYHLTPTNQMMQVINAQNILIIKLLQKQSLLYQQLNRKSTCSQSGSGFNGGQPINNRLQVDYVNNFQRSSFAENYQVEPEKQKNQTITTKINLTKNFKCQLDNSIQQEQNFVDAKPEKNNEKRKQSQTKNMIKNFAKAIFRFIHKNRGKRLQILGYLNISQEQFMKTFESYKGRIHSISQLRSLWTAQGNVHHKAFRMLSHEYLQKHCLAKTFNSRIENYSIHLKYRERLLEGIKHPQEFTLLKTS